MLRLSNIRRIAAALIMAAAVMCVPGLVIAQSDSPSPQPPLGEGEKPVEAPKPKPETKPDESKPPIGVGGDRPTAYPRIKIKNPAGEEQDVKIVAYVIDCSEEMKKTFVNARRVEVTRLSSARDQLKSSLDAMRNRRDKLFNISSYGHAQELAGKALPFSPTVEGINQAKTWLDELKAEGKADLYAILLDLFESEADNIKLYVGTLPGRPANVNEKELAKDAKAAAIQDFIVTAVENWRKAGKKTILDITGIELSDDGKAFYTRLAKAGGGAFTS